MLKSFCNIYIYGNNVFVVVVGVLYINPHISVLSTVYSLDILFSVKLVASKTVLTYPPGSIDR